MSDARVFTRDRVLTGVLGVLTAIAVYVCYLIIEPFIPSIAFAVALSVATQSPYRWIARRIPRPTVAATLAVILVAILIVGPAAFLITYIVQMAIDSIDEIQSGGGIASLRIRLESTPVIGPILTEFGGRFRLEEEISNLGKTLAARGASVLSGSIAVITQLGITLFVLFFLYRDRDSATESLRKLLPLSDAEADRLFARVTSTISATVNGSLTVAFIQALLAGIVYVFLGVPAAVLWGAVTFLVALIPVFGTFLVWSPIAAFLALSGSPAKALFLVFWGGVVVSSIDNVLYPHLVGDKLKLHTVPTFFSVIGGISVFGPSGIILGPIVLAVAIALIDVWWHRTEHGNAAEDAVPEDHQDPAEVLLGPEA